MSSPTREKINYILEMCADYYDNWLTDFDDNPHSEPVGEFDSRDVASLCTSLLSHMDRVEELEGALKPFSDGLTRYEEHWAVETGGQTVAEDDADAVSHLSRLGDFFDLVTFGDFRAARKALAQGGSDFPTPPKGDE